MIVNYVSCNCLYVSRNGLRVLGRKVMQQATLISTELEIRVLDEVVDYLTTNIAPSICRADYGKTDRPLKAGDEFIPRCCVTKFGAGENKLICGNG